MPQKLLFVFGTRPEAIKMAPVVHAAAADPRFDARVCVTGQHREMLHPFLDLFEIKPHHDLDLMRPNQNLYDLTARIITSIKPVLETEQPDWLLVQGDTTTVWAAALASFYHGNIRVGHVEAGLRTNDKRQPFPEEINRRICSVLADLHFAPTEGSKFNLVRENIDAANIEITGNTVIDALMWILARIKDNPPAEVKAIQGWCDQHVGDRRMVLITGHRRESFGDGFQQICQAIADLAAEYSDVEWVYPVHLNPNVQKPVRELLGSAKNIHLLDPQSYAPFAWLMQRSTIILTDSGGIQEEGPSLHKPVLVMRNTTERPEGVAAGCVQLVGNERDGIVAAMQATFNTLSRGAWPKIANPYGDGRAAARILEAIARRE